MKVLVLGGGGMLGHKAFQELSGELECYASFRSPSGAWQNYPFYTDESRLLTGVDALRFETIVSAFAEIRPDAVVNCIGIIKQLAEAKNPILSLQINALFPHQLASLCSASGARLIHISTDCVFNGSRGGYTEEDPSDALDLYGKSKSLGEVCLPGCLTLRTSIIGWDLAKSDGLLEWFYGQRGRSVKGYQNAVFSGLSTSALAGLILKTLLERRDLTGLYQISSDPINKFKLLTMLKQALKLEVEIEPVPEPRIDRSLDSSTFRAATGWSTPSWAEMVDQLAAERRLYDQWSDQHASSTR